MALAALISVAVAVPLLLNWGRDRRQYPGGYSAVYLAHDLKAAVAGPVGEWLTRPSSASAVLAFAALAVAIGSAGGAVIAATAGGRRGWATLGAGVLVALAVAGQAQSSAEYGYEDYADRLAVRVANGRGARDGAGRVRRVLRRADAAAAPAVRRRLRPVRPRGVLRRRRRPARVAAQDRRPVDPLRRRPGAGAGDGRPPRRLVAKKLDRPGEADRRRRPRRRPPRVPRDGPHRARLPQGDRLDRPARRRAVAADVGLRRRRDHDGPARRGVERLGLPPPAPSATSPTRGGAGSTRGPASPATGRGGGCSRSCRLRRPAECNREAATSAKADAKKSRRSRAAVRRPLPFFSFASAFALVAASRLHSRRRPATITRGP